MYGGLVRSQKLAHAVTWDGDINMSTLRVPSALQICRTTLRQIPPWQHNRPRPSVVDSLLLHH